MKIAFITSHINKSLQWLWFSEELVERGIEHIHIHISVEVKRPLMLSDLERIGVKVYELKHRHIGSHLVNFFKILSILRREQVDVVHTELPYGNLLGQPAAALLGIGKRVTTCENASWAHDFENRKQKLIDAWTYRLAKRVITLTDLSKEFLVKRYGVDSSKIRTVWHALKLSDYSVSDERVSRLKKALEIGEEDIIIGMVARLEKWKGHLAAIEAVKQLHAHYPNLKLLIFGSSGVDKEVINNAIKEQGLEEVVLIKGFVEDNLALYRLFDVQIHVPVNQMVETFGITLIEGMISGCAQVLTRSGISVHASTHMENALVVDYNSPEKIAQAVRKLLENPELRRQLGRAAGEYATEHFSYSSKIEKHLQIYSEL